MKYVVGGATLAILLLIALLVQGWGECSFSEEYATERVVRTLSKNQDAKYLSSPSFEREDCSYSYLYKSPNSKISYVFTGWGKVNRWDYERD
tara:strand:+ start:599 stop:874 length:276 start_codon:yes stop_codon:yes gene_type:complete